MTINKGTKFVVLTSQRSGSAWLISTLNMINDSTAYSELFLDRKRIPGEKKWDSDFAYPRFIEKKHNGLALRPFSVFSYLKGLYQNPGAVGFKLMYSQLRAYPEILFYLVRHRIRIVHLIRQNHLDVVISHAIRSKTKQSHLVTGQAKKDVQVKLDPNTLISQLKKLQRNIMLARRLLRWLKLPHIEVAYEDLLRDHSHFALIWEFLSINQEGFVPQSNLVKIRKGNPADVISNYEEIKTVLAGSSFANLID